MSLQKLAILTIALLISMSGVYANVLLSDQGGDVREISTGGLLALGNITITIYTDPVAGTQLYSQAFPNAINNGSWNVMITPDLQFGQRYWKDYEINGEDLDFDGQERVEFQSPLGLINNVSHINFSLIHSCPVGNAIRLIYANGSVECQSANNESSTSGGIGLISGGHYLYNDSISIYLNELALNNTIDARSAYSNGTGLELSGRVFSLITTCSNNQLLKWNNTALQWYCADDLAGSVDLANYALKNQSEIFAGNISTTQTGFFGFLGSLTQRITRLFVSDIDVGNNVQVAGNVTASKFIGDGSGLTNIPQANTYTHLSNFSDDLGNRGYTSLSNFTNDLAFINSSQIQAYNETTLINSVNTSLTSRIDSLSAQNASFNQTLTDSLYAANQWGYNQTIAANEYAAGINVSQTNWISVTFMRVSDMFSSYLNTSEIQAKYYNRSEIDQKGYLNSSQIQNLNETSLVLSINQTLSNDKLSLADQRYNDTNYINSAILSISNNLNSTYNETYDRFAYNQTLAANAYTDSINVTQTSWISATFLRIGDIIDSYLNKTQIQSQYYNKSDIDAREYVNSTQIAAYNDTALVNLVNQSLSSSKLDLSDQRYNDTTQIINVNTSLSNRLDLISTANNSFNQTLTDSLYAGIEWNYNQTLVATDVANEYTSQVNASIYNWGLNTFAKITDIISQYMNRSEIQLNYYNRSMIDSFGFVNSSSLAAYNDSEAISSTVAAYNASWSSTYNATYDRYAYNQTTAAVDNAASYTNTVNQTQSTWALATFLKMSDVLAQYYNRSDIDTRGYVNSSQLANYNETELIESINQTLTANKLDLSDQRYNETLVINLVNNSLSNQISLLPSSNGSFNQTLTDGLYAAARWGYNHTTIASNFAAEINQSLTISKLETGDQRYNETLLVIAINNSLTSRIDSFSGGNASFNQTYTDSLYAANQWAYNQTTPAIAYTDSKVSNYLNLSGTNANQNLNISGYNVTTTGTGLFGFLGSLTNRITKLWTVEINATGNIETSENVSARYFKGDGSLLTNLPVGVESDPSWSANFTNMQVECGSNNYAYGVYPNGSLKCRTDQSGEASFDPLQYNPTVKRQLSEVSTNDAVNWLDTDMVFDLVQDVTYNLRCDILFTGGAATTGQVINLSTTAATSNINVVYDTWSSATASVGLSATTFGTALTGTGSGATTKRPNLIVADFTATSDGILELQIRSEVAGSDTAISRGSICELYNVGDLQETPVNNATEQTPAVIRQASDVSTTSNSAWSTTDMVFDLEASKTYTFQCDILFTGGAATTGQVINLSTTAATSNINVVYDTWSSATASVGLSATTFGTALTGTGSGATIIKPNLILADFSTSTAGTLDLRVRSEISGSATTFERGSICRLFDLT